jgi:hypothetical protein
VAESDLQGNLQSEYVFFNKKRVARRDFPGGAVSYYFSDELKTSKQNEKTELKKIKSSQDVQEQ